MMTLLIILSLSCFCIFMHMTVKSVYDPAERKQHNPGYVVQKSYYRNTRHCVVKKMYDDRAGR